MMRLVRRNVTAASELVGFADKEVKAITLAVDEGCTNIIRHCYNCRRDKVIIVRIRMYSNRIEILLKDFGEEVDLKRLEASWKDVLQKLEDPESVSPGGLGVMLIHSVMDKVQYKTSKNFGTVLRLIKYLDKPGEASSWK
jgi:anti-sigma regulatory factor (Ser/Thr protein kinase)